MVNTFQHCETSSLTRMFLAVSLTLLQQFRAQHLSSQKAAQVFTISQEKKVEEVIKRLQNEERLSSRRVKYNLDLNTAKKSSKQVKQIQWLNNIKIAWLSSPLIKFQRQWSLQWISQKLGENCLCQTYSLKSIDFSSQLLEQRAQFNGEELFLAELLRQRLFQQYRSEILIHNIKELNKIEEHARKQMKCSQKLLEDCFSMPLAYFFKKQNKQQLSQIIRLAKRIQNQYYIYHHKLSQELLQIEEKQQHQKKKKKQKKKGIQKNILQQGKEVDLKKQALKEDREKVEKKKEEKNNEELEKDEDELWVPLQGNNQPLLLQEERQLLKKQQDQFEERTITISSISISDDIVVTPQKKPVYAKLQQLTIQNNHSDTECQHCHQRICPDCFSRFSTNTNLQEDNTSTSSLTMPRQFTPPLSPSEKIQINKMMSTQSKKKKYRLCSNKSSEKKEVEKKEMKEMKENKEIKEIKEIENISKQVINQVFTVLLEQKIKQLDLANQNVWEAKNIATNYVTSLINFHFPFLQPTMFGSNITGLALSHSDIDLLITPMPNYYIGKQILLDLARLFGQVGWVVYCHAITTAKIPVLKLLIDPTVHYMGYSPYRQCEPAMFPSHLIHVDVTLNCQGEGNTGVHATTFMQEILSGKPHLRNLILLIKHLLQRRDLNESYKGGISSYVLFLMVVCCLEHLHIDSEQTCLGLLFLTILKFYCQEFDHSKQALWFRKGIPCFIKIQDCEINLQNSVPVKIIDPVNNRQIMASFSKISKVIEVFENFLEQQANFYVKSIELAQHMLNNKVKTNRLKKHIPKELLKSEESTLMRHLLNL